MTTKTKTSTPKASPSANAVPVTAEQTKLVSKTVRTKSARETTQSYIDQEAISKIESDKLTQNRKALKAELTPFEDEDGDMVAIFIVPLGDGAKAQVTRKKQGNAAKASVLDSLLVGKLLTPKQKAEVEAMLEASKKLSDVCEVKVIA